MSSPGAACELRERRFWVDLWPNRTSCSSTGNVAFRTHCASSNVRAHYFMLQEGWSKGGGKSGKETIPSGMGEAQATLRPCLILSMQEATR